MTRLCQSCRLKSCDGIECYFTDPSDYPEDEPTTSTLTIADLLAKYGPQLVREGPPLDQLTEVVGDPLLNRRAA